MIDPLRYSDLVGAIYDCALDPAHWAETLGRLCAVVDAATGIFSHVSRGPRSIPLVATGMSDDDLRGITDYDADVFALWGGPAAFTRPIDRPWVASRLASPEFFAANRYVREWAAPRDLVDCAAVVVSRSPELMGVIAMGRHRRFGLMDDRSIAALEMLTPHLQRAARITGLLDANGDALRNFEAVIGAILAPAFIVRQDLSIVFKNAAADALAARGDVLRAVHGRITAREPGLERALRRLLARISADETAVSGYELGLPVRTAAGQVCTLNLLPLAGGRARVAGEAVAAIFVSANALDHVPALDLLGPLFALTAAEQRVFELIVAGRKPREVAAQLGVALSTVRTHLLRIFEKTGVNRQAALIRLAHALAAPTAPARG
ncbi:MAG: helix-turn-helix transcriptional regulator [Alphaproteobacteria bacterium]|nr:helix-turn-helix transcriptional regulator [Alphaproteobacteria bacterium]